MRMRLEIFVLCAILIPNSYCYEDAVLQINTGKIKGIIVQTRNNNTFYAYQQIPFAEPPIGELRFEAPVPAKSWEGVLDCTKNTNICMQTASIYAPPSDPNSTETEDCLYVNVYTPLKPGDTKSLPVIYYIHGGGYVFGNHLFKTNGPHYFMDNDVVLVTVGYRLGAFGFISTNDLELAGNNGLKDQHLGLLWVQDNIKYFGGDPTKVTLMGQSAGAASVAFQIMKKNPKKLFRGAILQSGSTLIPSLFQRNARTLAFSLGYKLNFTGTTSKDLKEHLRALPATDIQTASGNLAEKISFTPTLEEEHHDAFNTKSMYDLVDSGSRVPLVIGIASEEQIFQNLNSNFLKTMQPYDENPSLLVNDDFHISNTDTKTLVGQKIRQIYTNGSFQDNLAASIRYFSDDWLTRSVMHYADLYSKYADVYFYQFSYSGPMGQNEIPKVPGAGKVGHSEDNFYLWVNNGNDSEILQYPKQDQLTSKLYVKLFSNFAKNLKPIDSSIENVVWPKMEPGSFKYLNIDDSVEMDVNPRGDSYEKWVDLYMKYALKPLDTF